MATTVHYAKVADFEATVALLDQALAHANDQYEQSHLPAQQAGAQRTAAAANAAAERQGALDARAAKLERQIPKRDW